MRSADSCRLGASGPDAARNRKGSSSAHAFSGRRSAASSDMASHTFFAMGLGGSDWSAERRCCLSAACPAGERWGHTGARRWTRRRRASGRGACGGGRRPWRGGRRAWRATTATRRGGARAAPGGTPEAVERRLGGGAVGVRRGHQRREQRVERRRVPPRSAAAPPGHPRTPSDGSDWIRAPFSGGGGGGG